MADQGCYSTIDSSDWRKRLLSEVSTKVAFAVLIDELRTPMVRGAQAFRTELSKKKWPGTTRQEALQKVQEFAKARACVQRVQGPQGIQTRFVPHETIIALAKKIGGYADLSPDKNPGLAFMFDMMRRMENIAAAFFKPEQECLRWLDSYPKSPMIPYHKGEKKANEEFLIYTLSRVAARRIFNSEKPMLDWRLTAAILEDCFRDTDPVVKDGVAQTRRAKFVNACLKRNNGRPFVLTW